jgi:hypothetical protein
MNRHHRPQPAAGLMLLALVGYAAAVGCLSGCTQYVDVTGKPVSPQEAGLIRAEDVYTAFVGELDAALVGGYLQPAQIAPWLPVRNAARTALDAAEGYARRGDLASVSAQVDVANQALQKLGPLRDYIKTQAAAKGGKAGGK